MKTWMIVAAVVLAPMLASAQWRDGAPSAPANEESRAGLLKEIEATRDALLPQAEPLPPVTTRHQPKLDEIKASAAAAKTGAELYRARAAFGTWKTAVLRSLHVASQRLLPDQTFAAFSAVQIDRINFTMALRQQFVAQRLLSDGEMVRSFSKRDPSMANLFDNSSPFRSVSPVLPGSSDGAVRANTRAANDPGRYDKIRALLLSQGVSRQIVDTAIAEGIRQKVDPMIVLSVINQESNFRKNAYNRGSGCTGLMQLAPETAADMGVRGNLYDPASNIKAGVKYLNWIANSYFKMNLDMSDLSKVPAEKLEIVLASYNWGIGNVRKVLRRHGAAALDRVAPRETRNYIAQIPSRISNWFAAI